MGEHPLKAAFKAFRDECAKCCKVAKTHAALFEGGEEQVRLLMEPALNFFHDFSVISQEDRVMLVGRMTDPAATGERWNCVVKTRSPF